MSKRIASLSLDLDNQWSYMKTHGDPGWETFPSYFDVAVPRILELLDELDLSITFFVVGQDAALEKNKPALQSIAAAGHEIGNHSFRHEPWLHMYTSVEFEQDLTAAQEAIQSATGHLPVGFRGPGFSISAPTLQILAKRGFLYDGSTFPTFIGPLARAYYFMHSTLAGEDRERRSRLFGTANEGFLPLTPYRWDSASGLIEIPVTTVPIFKIPFHLSYVSYLSTFSAGLANTYFKSALLLCQLTGTQPSVLLHPLDFLGGDDVPTLAFFPAMQTPAARKMATARKTLQVLKDSYQILTMEQHASLVAQETGIAVADSSTYKALLSDPSRSSV